MSKTTDKNIELRRLHVASAGLFAALAVIAGALMHPSTYQMMVGYLTQDHLASSSAGNVIFAQGRAVLFDLDIRWILVAWLLLAAVLPVLFATKWQKRYQSTLKDRVNVWRWIDLAIVGSLLMSVVALLSGVGDFTALKSIATLTVVGAGLWYLSERLNMKKSRNSRSDRRHFWLGLVALAVPLLMIVGTGLAGLIYGDVRLSWHVYALQVTAVAGFGAMALNQWFGLSGKKQSKDYLLIERNHVLVRLGMITLVAALLIVGFSDPALVAN